MPQKLQPALLYPESFVNPNDSSFWLDAGQIYSDGQGNLNAASLNPSLPTTAPQVIATNGAIVIPAFSSVVRLAPAAAVTGVTLPNGPANRCMMLVIINTSIAASSVTLAGANVAQAYAIAGVSKLILFWDYNANIWY